MANGKAADISRQDADDVLDKLTAEKIRVQATFVGRGSVAIAVQGTASIPQDGLVMVSENKSVIDASFVFGLQDVKTFKYGDACVFPGSSGVPGTPQLNSALCFVYPDGAKVVLFEIVS